MPLTMDRNWKLYGEGGARGRGAHQMTGQTRGRGALPPRLILSSVKVARGEGSEEALLQRKIASARQSEQTKSNGHGCGGRTWCR